MSKSKMSKVYIMRGLPGSGKTSWVAKNVPNYTGYFSVDRERTTHTGYAKDITWQRKCQYHNDVLAHFAKCVSRGNKDEIYVVDNCNLEVHMIAPYYRLAEAFDYEIEIVEMQTPLSICESRNLHGVTYQQLTQLSENIEGLPKHWRVTCVDGCNQP